MIGVGTGISPVFLPRTSASAGVPSISMGVLFRRTLGSDGALATLIQVNSDTLGAATGFTASVRNPFTHILGKNITPIELPTAWSCAGVTVTEVSKTLRLDISLAQANGLNPLYEGVRLSQAGNFSANLKEFSYGYIFGPNLITGTNNVGFDLFDCQGTGFSFPQIRCLGSGEIDIRIHSGAGDSALRMLLDGTKYYLVSVRCSEAENLILLEVHDLTTGLSVGTIKSAFTITAVSYFTLQSYLLLATPDGGGGAIDVPIAGIREAIDVFPLYTGYVVPTPGSIVLTQTALNTIRGTFTLKSPSVTVTRSINGGAYSAFATYDAADITVAGVVGPCAFEDNTVSDGQVVRYRFVATTQAYSSAVGQSDPITVNNAPFLVGNPIVTAYPGGFGADVPAGIKFTWNTANSTVTELGFVPGTTASYSVVISLRRNSDGVIIATQTFTGAHVSGVEEFLAVTPVGITNGQVYRLTMDSITPGEQVREAVGTGGFTFASSVTATSSVAPDGSDPVLAACVNLKATTP